MGFSAANFLNYVIQNFNFEFFSINFTPRIKFFFFLKNIHFFFFFLIHNFYFLFFKNQNFYWNFYKYIFIKFFFFNQIFKFFKKIDLNTLSFFDNKITKSYLFWIFFSLIENFKNNFFFNPQNLCLVFSFNVFLLPLKFSNNNISSYLFKNLFFFFLSIFSFFFINNNLNLKYLSNSLLILNEFSFHSFYGGYFFNIYSL